LTLKERLKRISEYRLIKLIGNKWVITTLLFFIWVVFFDSNSVIQCSRIHSNIREQERAKTLYKERIEAIDEKIRELDSNKSSLEKFARERFLFKEEDEDLFVVEREAEL